MTRAKRIFAAVMVLVMIAGCLTGCGSGNAAGGNGAQSGNRTINLAIQPSCAFIPLVIARESGWIDEAMKEIGVEVVWTEFESGPPMNESVERRL